MALRTGRLPMGGAAFSSPSPLYPKSHRFHCNQPREEHELIDTQSIERVEEDLNRLIERRAEGISQANAAAAMERATVARRTRAARLENVRGWVEHYGALSLAAHDAAARYAEKRDKYAAIARELETNHRGDAA